MLDKIPFKKDYLFLAAVLIAALICYQLAFKKTIEALHIHGQLSAQLETAADVSYQPAYLERKSANLSKLVGRFRTDTVAFRSNVISSIAALAERNKVKLSEVPVQDALLRNEKYIVQKLSFEGTFFDLTSFLNQMERAKNAGFVRSFSYKTVRKNTSAGETKAMVLDVYLEIVK